MIYFGPKIHSLLNWQSHAHTIATKLCQAKAILLRVRDLINANGLKSIYYALVQLTVFIFYRERCLELLNVHSVMLNDLLCFIFLA